MEKSFFAPSEVANAIIPSLETKANLSITRLLILGIMAGVYIGLGGFGFIMVTETLKR